MLRKKYNQFPSSAVLTSHRNLNLKRGRFLGNAMGIIQTVAFCRRGFAHTSRPRWRQTRWQKRISHTVYEATVGL
ncbi:hypothetical protein TorRG33x02_311320 [Trema orientale]|uniref:Uncharacterized protein n=1 Tax=Trema orientale TaxID=63057 RepID=A0A2P5BRN7_TREOI|nr:hypothetical protein TorRG33x02_311320 [Trema orientale]